MSNQSIVDKLLVAMEMVAKNETDNSGADRTFSGTIISQSETDKTKYIVRIDGADHQVSSTYAEYKVNDEVYVTMPGGLTASNMGVIIGLKYREYSGALNQAISDNYDKLTSNVLTEVRSINNNGSITAIDNDALRAVMIPQAATDDAPEVLGSDTLLAIFDLTATASDGDYELIFEVTYKFATNEEAQIKEFAFTINDVHGNPFALTNQQQFLIIQLPEGAIFDSVNEITLSSTNATVTVNNLELYGAREAFAAKITAARLWAPDGAKFDSATMSTLTLKAQMRKEGLICALSNTSCYWFKEDPLVTSADNPGYSTQGGMGWRLLNTKTEDGTIVLMAPILEINKTDIVRENVKYKCVIEYNGQVYSSANTVTFTNVDAPKLTFNTETSDDDENQVYLVATVAPTGAYTYELSAIDAYGDIIDEEDLPALVDGFMNKWGPIDISQINIFNTYTCQVITGNDFIDRESVKLKNPTMDENTEPLTLTLDNDSDIIVRTTDGQLIGISEANPLIVNVRAYSGSTDVTFNPNTFITIDGYNDEVAKSMNFDFYYNITEQKAQLRIKGFKMTPTAMAGEIEIVWKPSADAAFEFARKKFTYKIIVANVDYNLKLTRIVINLDNEGDKTVSVTVLKKTMSENPVELTAVGDNKLQLLVGEEDYTNENWSNITISADTVVQLKSTAEELNDLIWDTQTIETVSNGEPGEPGQQGDSGAPAYAFITYRLGDFKLPKNTWEESGVVGHVDEWNTTADRDTVWNQTTIAVGDLFQVIGEDEFGISHTLIGRVQVAATSQAKKVMGTTVSHITSGDSVSIITQTAYYRSNSATPPISQPTTGQNETLNTGWAFAPQGVTDKLQYEYLNMRTKTITNGIASYTNWGTTVLWAKYGVDGDEASITRINTMNALTNGLEKVGIYYVDAKGNKITDQSKWDSAVGLYINASMINSGALQVADANGNVKFYADVDNGNITLGNFNVSATTNGTGSISSGKTSLTSTSAGVYLGTDGIAIGNGSTNEQGFRVDKNGTAIFTGEITATKLTLGSNVKVSATSVSGLADVATSGDYSSLKSTPDLTQYATTSQLSNYATTSQLANYATTGQLSAYLKTNELNSQLGTLKVAYRGDVTTTQSTDTNGITTTTSTYIGADGQTHTTTTYTTEGGNYVLLNKTNQWGTENSLVKIEKNGLLTANNAIITGTIYATDGYFTGEIKAGSKISINDKFSVTDAGYLTALSGNIGGWSINTSYLSSKYCRLYGNASTETIWSPLSAAQIPVVLQTGEVGTNIPVYRYNEIFTIPSQNIGYDEEGYYVIGPIRISNYFLLSTETFEEPPETVDIKIRDSDNNIIRTTTATVQKEGLDLRINYTEYGLDGEPFDLVIVEMITIKPKSSINLASDGFFSAERGHITTIVTTSAPIIASDERVKNSIAPLSQDYEIIFDNLEPVSYKYNNGTSGRTHIGFIAQPTNAARALTSITQDEFAPLCLVNRDQPNEHWAIRYEEFIALNTDQIQKTKKRVAELETENLKLHERIGALEDILKTILKEE